MTETKGFYSVPSMMRDAEPVVDLITVAIKIIEETQQTSFPTRSGAEALTYLRLALNAVRKGGDVPVSDSTPQSLSDDLHGEGVQQ